MKRLLLTSLLAGAALTACQPAAAPADEEQAEGAVVEPSIAAEPAATGQAAEDQTPEAPTADVVAPAPRRPQAEPPAQRPSSPPAPEPTPQPEPEPTPPVDHSGHDMSQPMLSGG